MLVLVVLCVYAICKHRRETPDIFEHEIIPTNLSLFRSQRSGRQCDIDLPVVSIPHTRTALNRDNGGAPKSKPEPIIIGR